jgi:dTDP-4-amino-4,6-dideoxygalactose transaminase
MVPPLVAITIDEDDVHLAKNWLENSNEWYSNEEVDKYQQEFASWNGSKYVFSFLGGRVALSAIISALNLNPGDEVIIPGYTCIVVPNAFRYAGIEIVYSDIELNSYGLDAAQIEEKISTKTKAILIQHLYGLVARDYQEIIDLAKSNSLYLIEDCAHSTGAEFNGRKVGNWGDVAFYSSERSKVFSTVIGGLAVTNDDSIGSQLKEFYDLAPYPNPHIIEDQLYNVIIDFNRYKHPQRWWRGDYFNLRYSNKLIVSTTNQELQGIRPTHYGHKMPAPIAALGRNQLKKIDHYNHIRINSAKHWGDWCDQNGYQRPFIHPQSKPIYLRYPVLVEPGKKKDKVWAPRSFGIQIGVWFKGKTHPTDEDIKGCPNANIAVRQCINFPTIYSDLLC